MSVHITKDGRWFAKYYLPGSKVAKREYFGRGHEAEMDARQWDHERQEARRNGFTMPRDGGATGKVFTFAALAQAYISGRPLSEKHGRCLAATLNTHVLPLFGNTPVKQLTMKDLANLDERLRELGRTLATRNRTRTYCKVICNWGVKNDLIESNPFAKFSPDLKHENRAPDPPTDEELRKIWAAAPDHLQWLIFCMVHLGLRPGPSELFSVRMSDVDLASGGVWVTRRKTHSPRAMQPARQEFLQAASELIQREPDRQYLIEFKGKPVGSMKTTWKKTLKRAGIVRRLRLYDLRHLYATSLLRAGADLKAVSELMGHSSTRVTGDIYYHLLEGQKRAALDRLPAFGLPLPTTSQGEK